jgi:hypothetical protein
MMRDYAGFRPSFCTESFHLSVSAGAFNVSNNSFSVSLRIKKLQYMCMYGFFLYGQAMKRHPYCS